MCSFAALNLVCCHCVFEMYLQSVLLLASKCYCRIGAKKSGGKKKCIITNAFHAAVFRIPFKHSCCHSVCFEHSALVVPLFSVFKAVISTTSNKRSFCAFPAFLHRAKRMMAVSAASPNKKKSEKAFKYV